MQEVGDKFNLEVYLKARDLAQKIVNDATASMEVGMTEIDGHEILAGLFEKYQIEKKWHPSKFRIGVNTTKAFREKSEPGIKLQKNDIFFIDIGPVINKHEADFGASFSIGTNEEYQKIIKASESVFYQTKKLFKKEGKTGKELYDFAQQQAQSLGFILNNKMAGHRLGDFPHALFYKGQLASIDEVPRENLWVLEILLRHPSNQYGAFYEDII